ncbi:CPBP family intramembrane glutamic endopeptidase [Haloarculaceae archaeon H-GB2-1]|nr:CPBP family intramembrane metalloprotease [Haloarculaceae archaeon H-GB1-1]MEA5387503.1 CPBP family intramembrane glutamic endopeptidase [Haloarculaceae archaeon H-GB11]MEA5408985.1 CPBP family intramembrane glutamic endopeptidase [Haloarculaceae archaeon H-GB2-1]
MPEWAAFAGLTGLVLTAFLALARASQSTLTDRTTVVRPLDHRDPGVGESTETVPLEPLRESLTPGLLLVNVALTQGLFGAVVLGGVFYFTIPLAALGIPANPLAGRPVPLALGVALGVALWLGNELGTLAADAGGIEYDESLRDLLAPDTLRGWLVLLVAVLPLIAGVEELVFRAAFVGALSVGFGASPWGLAVVSSVAFALGHGAQGPAGIALTGLLGLALAAAFVLTESLLVVVVAHYLVNALELTVHEGLGVPKLS